MHTRGATRCYKCLVNKRCQQHNARAHPKATPLMCAVRRHDEMAVRRLLMDGADPAAPCKALHRLTALHIAVIVNDKYIAKLLLQENPSALLVEDTLGHTPLDLARALARDDICMCLVTLDLFNSMSPLPSLTHS